MELSIYFGRIGHKGLKGISTNSIQIQQDDKGRNYTKIIHNETEKTKQMQDPKDSKKIQILYEDESSPFCPIMSKKKYLQKVNPRCDVLFQWP